MAVEDWLDDLAARWDGVSDGRGGHVRSYRTFDPEPRNNIPEASSDYPFALTYTVDVTPVYSVGGVCVDLYRGRTEFHLFGSSSKVFYGQAMLYVARIRNAAAASITLGGKVAHFLLRSDQPGIRCPVVLDYGTPNEHLGALVEWEVKETVSGDFTVAA